MTDLLWFFWMYSFGGYLLERAFAALTRAERRERKCFLLLPLCPVYGLGMLAVLALPESWRQSLWLIPAGAAAATAVEYAVHWVYETFLGVEFWDYSHLPGSVGGRVCLPFTLAWGALVWAAVRFVQPGAAALAAAAPAWLAYLFLLVFTADAVCSLWFLRVTGDLKGMRAAVFP